MNDAHGEYLKDEHLDDFEEDELIPHSQKSTLPYIQPIRGKVTPSMTN